MDGCFSCKNEIKHTIFKWSSVTELLTIVISVILDQVGGRAQRVESVVGDLQHEASIDETVGGAKLAVRAQPAVEVAHALDNEQRTMII